MLCDSHVCIPLQCQFESDIVLYCCIVCVLVLICAIKASISNLMCAISFSFVSNDWLSSPLLFSAGSRDTTEATTHHPALICCHSDVILSWEKIFGFTHNQQNCNQCKIVTSAFFMPDLTACICVFFSVIVTTPSSQTEWI